jgi:hypothetical protein
MVFLEFNQLLIYSCMQFQSVNVVPKYFISATFSKVFVCIPLLIRTCLSQEFLPDLISMYVIISIYPEITISLEAVCNIRPQVVSTTSGGESAVSAAAIWVCRSLAIFMTDDAL